MNETLQAARRSSGRVTAFREALKRQAHSFKQRYFSLFLAQAAPLTVSLVLTLATAAILGPAGRGVLTFMMTSALMSGALAYGSIHVPVVGGLRNGDKTPLRYGARLIGALWAVLTLVGVALTLLSRISPRVHVSQILLELGCGLIGSGVVVAQLFIGRVLQGLGRNRDYGRVLAAQSAMYLIVAGGMLVVTRAPWLVFWGWYASVLASLGLASAMLRRALNERPMEATSTASWRDFLRATLANNIGSVGQMLMLRADVIVVGVVLGAAATGIYGVATSLTGVALIPAEILALSVFSNRAAMTDRRWYEAVGRAIRSNWIIFLLSAAVIGFGTTVLVRGPLHSYHGLVMLIALILPGSIFAGYSRITLSALQALGKASSVWRFGVLAVAMAVGYIPAAALGGTAGLATMSSIAYALTAIYLRRALAQERLQGTL